LAGKKRVLRLQDDCLRIQFLARAPRRTIHLTSSTLDARERVEDRLLSEILDRLEPDLLLLEIEILEAAELRRLQEHGDWRQDEMEMLRRGNQCKKREHHQHVRPPVDAAGNRTIVEREPE